MSGIEPPIDSGQAGKIAQPVLRTMNLAKCQYFFPDLFERILGDDFATSAAGICDPLTTFASTATEKFKSVVYYLIFAAKL